MYMKFLLIKPKMLYALFIFSWMWSRKESSEIVKSNHRVFLITATLLICLQWNHITITLSLYH